MEVLKSPSPRFFCSQEIWINLDEPDHWRWGKKNIFSSYVCPQNIQIYTLCSPHPHPAFCVNVQPITSISKFLAKQCLWLDWKASWDLTSEEPLHAVTVGHLEQATARIRGQGGVSAIRQQDSHHVQVVILHGIMNRSRHTEIYIHFNKNRNSTDMLRVTLLMAASAIQWHEREQTLVP